MTWDRSRLASVPWVTTTTGREPSSSDHQLGGCQSAARCGVRFPTRCSESGASLRGNSNPATVSAAVASGTVMIPSTNAGNVSVAPRERRISFSRSWVGCVAPAKAAFAARLAAAPSSPGPTGTGPKNVVSRLASANGTAETATQRSGLRPGAPIAGGTAPRNSALQIRYWSGSCSSSSCSAACWSGTGLTKACTQSKLSCSGPGANSARSAISPNSRSSKSAPPDSARKPRPLPSTSSRKREPVSTVI